MIDSPCVKSCKLNEEKICSGCKRTVTEIAEWSRLSPLHKAQIIKRLESYGA
jgi:uncharacterized protein